MISKASTDVLSDGDEQADWSTVPDLTRYF
jgi:hypothetical protein